MTDTTSRAPDAPSTATVRPWLWAAAGFCALLLGLGFGRFSYTPILPALVAHGWLDASAAAYLGAMNLGGYFVGALLLPSLAARLPALLALRVAMALTVLSLAACALPWGFVWLAFWRFLAGLTGAMLMVTAPPVVLSALPAAWRGRGLGLVFAGAGAGVMLSGTAVAALASAGPQPAWLTLAAVGAVMTLAVWWSWPPSAARPAARPTVGVPAGTEALPMGRLLLLAAAYAADGAGFVPHSVFLSDYVARGLDQGVAAGGTAWVFYGVGAMAGPLLVGPLGARFGFRRTFVTALAVKSVLILLPLMVPGSAAIWLSAFVVGGLTPGMAAIAAGVVADVVGPRAYASTWRWMTAAYAAAQAAGAFGFSAMLGAVGSHPPLFIVGGALLAAGAILAIFGVRAQPPRADGQQRTG